MKPENVNPKNFNVIEIIYNNNDFSIAYGNFENGDNCIAMRWNGKDEDKGYPKTFGNPMWFIIENKLKTPFLKSLLGEKYAENLKILEILKDEI